ncbi:cysteine-rich CWC family protein [Aureispira anguillae]|uniref:Cysteine-rich CWC n=1 Tax=Aureispira anguillae TaxID=2864201 RepID=A0A915VKD8_9BACT|nr:hypothetical protein AsAng_0002460 [Aureispira anguillae]
MKKICSNCQTTFICNANDIANCQCSSVQLDKTAIALLEKTYKDCLCISCLQKIGSSLKKSSFVPPSKER